MIDDIVTGERRNAIVGWVFVGTMALGVLESLRSDALLWAGFSLLVAAVAALPALWTWNWTAMVPWSLPSVAAIALVSRAAGVFAEFAGYLAIATLALLVVVEIDLFTPVALGRRFAVGFGVLTTMAIEALWIVAQFYSDRWLGTGFLSTQTELQEDIVAVTVVGFAAGGLFYWLFGRYGYAGATSHSSNRARSR